MGNIMALVVCGVNHKTAPVAVRECFAFDATTLPKTLQRLVDLSPAREAVILTTCNRTEVYLETDSVLEMHRWIHNHIKCYKHDMLKVGYFLHGEQALQHLLKVAVGADSLVLGEPEILGQLKQAYQLAQQSQVAKRQFNQLFPAVFSMAKKIRTHTQIGKSSLTLASVVVQLAKKEFGCLSSLRVMLVGAGEMMQLIATYFSQRGVKNLTVANRTIEKAQSFVESFSAKAIRIGDIPQELPQIDVMVTATASQLPIIGKGMVEHVVGLRGGRRLMMVDLAVPRDIEPEIGALEFVDLYDMDVLQEKITSNQQSREIAAKQARAMIAMEAQRYMRSQRVTNLSDTIRQFRQKMEVQRDEALGQALLSLNNGHDPEKVMGNLARSLTNKLLHQPTSCMRDAAFHQREDSLKIIKELFDLE